ncbi:UvrD-helicase domain-containing protein [Telmatospirillum sp.]|uniref:UvrD-helicase domain-containing protein n=1 Tax=Telmatospirillum sp. TaxID=2079197 RepID=UPI00284F1496|nr:UvrD-helicase domain-containing protein [Telmatospirillum sp.]MDR3437088.1 UvrD-helicase domain-containing protein [Telmatospirillum sp.]
MIFHADLHVHSKYSRATSRDLDFEHLAWWAARKGIAVVATGDCVHPAWLGEIRDKLLPVGNGLFRLRPEIEAEVWKTLPPACQVPVHFMLSVEISTIYKKGEKTRKVHHLIYVPDLPAADRLAEKLGKIGNIASDGRPILGLDSRNLLEVALESSPDAYLVPAHIWTPWFAALGSQSGFDSIAECYGDLASHIFAVETGLSSDPEMNWRVSSLDRYRLVSNSDAHSPGKLAREATRFSCEADYFAIRRALECGDGYRGTVEFFPEEGKYHMDGHRACDVCFEPRQTIAAGGLCPVCGKPLTVGVAHRVEMLADRENAQQPATAGAVTSLVPLPEVLSEIVGSGAASKAVENAYDRTISSLGSELSVLEDLPIEDISRIHPLLGEAITRLRAGTVIRQAGYDGEYGVIRLFADGELDRLNGGELLFDTPIHRRKAVVRRSSPVVREAPPDQLNAVMPPPSGRTGILAALDADQGRAAEAIDGPLVVVAGPGSGKTRMLTHRLAHLIVERGVPAARCLAITFTRRATEEMQVRLARLLPPAAGAATIHSFHSLGLAILRAHGEVVGLAANFRIADDAERATALAAALDISDSKARRLLKTISVAKRTGNADDEGVRDALAASESLARRHNWVDFDDLVAMAVAILATHADIAAAWRDRFSYLSVDEFQDVDEQQYRLLCLLAAPDGNICVIGDPNQAIYGFRGADAGCFERFSQDFPTARTESLGRNYRSTGTIVTAAAQVIGAGTPADIIRPMQAPIAVHAAATERAEAEFVATSIETLLGGHDMLAAGRPAGQTMEKSLGFADFAVLYRTDAQAAALREAFDRAGIPFKKSSPAPLAEKPAIQAVLAALALADAANLPARIRETTERLRRTADDDDTAALAEAGRWLTALADGTDETTLRERVALATEADFWDARADRVSLLTMHASKGLEFPVVFLVGLEDGLMPLSWPVAAGDIVESDNAERQANMAEERRLFYVAMTRAKDRLFLCRAMRRFWRGSQRTPAASPFLAAIASDLTVQPATSADKRGDGTKQYSLF